MQIVLTYLITNLLDNKPEVIDYVYVFTILDIIEEELKHTKNNMIKEIELGQKNNFDLTTQYMKENLDKLNINKDIKLDFNEYKSKTLPKLVEKHFNKLTRTMSSQVLNMLNNGKTNELENYLTTVLGSERKSKSLVGRLMRVYRTENTMMRSRIKLDVQEELAKEGIIIKRKWMHTLSNPSNVIGANYTPRDDHLALNGVVEDSRGYFHTYTGASTRAPGMFGLPEEDINCRCDVEFVLDKNDKN